MTQDGDRDGFVRAYLADHPDAVRHVVALYETNWEALSPTQLVLVAELVALRARIAELEAR